MKGINPDKGYMGGLKKGPEDPPAAPAGAHGAPNSDLGDKAPSGFVLPPFPSSVTVCIGQNQILLVS